MAVLSRYTTLIVSTRDGGKRVFTGGDRQMGEYKIYCLHEAGKIASAPEHLDATSDEEAMALLRSQKRLFSCEVWERNRLVGRIPPHTE
jgi:hypothetical protein